MARSKRDHDQRQSEAAPKPPPRNVGPNQHVDLARGKHPHMSETRLAERTRAVAETAGALTGAYRSEELKRLRDDWPH